MNNWAQYKIDVSLSERCLIGEGETVMARI